MTYWLDPHSAAAATGAPGEPMIFVPAGAHISPPVTSFGGNLDETLRLVLGSLFAEAGVILKRPGAQPVFLFSPPEEDGFDMTLEMLDAADFAPVHLNLAWLNDHMLVRSPKVAERADLDRLAEALFAGEVAEALIEGSRGAGAALDAVWTGTAATVTRRFEAITATLTDELRQIAERVVLTTGLAAEARRRVDETERAIGRFDVAMRATGATVSRFRRETQAQSGAQADFAQVLLRELARSAAAVEAAEAEIVRERQRIAGIVDRLEDLG